MGTVPFASTASDGGPGWWLCRAPDLAESFRLADKAAAGLLGCHPRHACIIARPEAPQQDQQVNSAGRSRAAPGQNHTSVGCWSLSVIYLFATVCERADV
jgi:hypothetical protein